MTSPLDRWPSARTLTPGEKARLLEYIEILLRWNKRINLTAARTVEDVAGHIADCLALLPHVPEEAARLVDVGSGGGLPALVIAIMRPTLEVVALESIHKKVAFLSTAGRTLGLDRFRASAERVEVHEGRDYDVATSRATFALPTWFETGSVLVRPGGVVLGMEGSDAMDLAPGITRHSYKHADRTRAILVQQR